jgi:hypothetical protein
MRVYAVCRKCAEVHLGNLGCPRCARRLIAQPPGFSAFGDETTPTPIPARPEPTSLATPTAPARIWRLSTLVVGAYLLIVLGLLAAAILGL